MQPGIVHVLLMPAVIVRQIVKQLEKLIAQVQGEQPDADGTPADLAAHYLPFLRTVADAASAGQTPDDKTLLRLKDLTVELVDMLADELRGNPHIWRPNKVPDQENLNSLLYERLLQTRPPLLSEDKAAALADQLMQQARANHDKLVAAA